MRIYLMTKTLLIIVSVLAIMGIVFVALTYFPIISLDDSEPKSPPNALQETTPDTPTPPPGYTNVNLQNSVDRFVFIVTPPSQPLAAGNKIVLNVSIKSLDGHSSPIRLSLLADGVEVTNDRIQALGLQTVTTDLLQWRAKPGIHLLEVVFLSDTRYELARWQAQVEVPLP